MSNSRGNTGGGDVERPSAALLELAELEQRIARLEEENRSLQSSRRRLEEEVAFLDQILESLPYPFYVIDAMTYQVIKSNTAARIESLGGAVTCHALTHGRPVPCDSSGHPCPLETMRVSKQPVVVEHVHLSGDGEPFHAEVHAFPILDVRGELVRMVEYSIDISKRKRAEEEREAYVQELEAAVSRVRTLRGLLPICSSCKKIRDDKGYWTQVEEYLLEHSDAEFSHSYCPECAEKALRVHRESK